MLRQLYKWLLVLHPSKFRNRFGEEMLSIFDEANGNSDKRETARLVSDAATSFLRQWLVRPENWEEQVVEPIRCSSSGAPVFFTLDEYRPRTSALVSGGFVTLILFCTAWAVSEYTWTHPMFMPFRTVPAYTYFAQPETSQQSPLPLATIPSQRLPVQQASHVTTPVGRSTSIQSPAPTQIRSARNAVSPKPENEGAAIPFSQSQSTGVNESTPSADRSGQSIASETASEDRLQSYVGIYASAKVRVVITAENGYLTM